MFGIRADYSDLDIENVTITGNSAHGIYFVNGKSFTIRNSTIEGNDGGGVIYYNAANGDAIVEDNTIINNVGSGVHIRLAEGKSATIRNNEIDNNAGSSSDGIYVNIAGSGGLMTIENNPVKDSGRHGFYLIGVRTNSSITDFSVQNSGSYGIRADYSDLNIENVTITGNDAHGIYFVNGKSFSIRNSIIEGNGGGLIYYNAANGDAIVEDNIIINNVGSGVHIRLAEGKSATIRNNKIVNNAGSSSDGIYVNIAGSGGVVTIENNLVKNNGDDGIYLTRAKDSVIINNNISTNVYGIRLYSSSNNLIFHNNLINNYNTYDTGTNQWDSGTVGNYHSDYTGTGTDSNGDGIGDIPHPIPGGSNEDRYPLMSPYMIDIKPPFSISNLHSFPGSTWIKWTWTNPSDPDFSYTEIYLNNIHQTSTSSHFFNATPLTPNTEYTISTRTVDTSGNINTTWVNNTATTQSPSKININLYTGWNLISGPLNLITWDLGEEETVGNPLNVTPKNCLTSIYRYNTTSGTFEKCDYFDNWGWSPATGSESFIELEPGRGYWVMATNECVWSIKYKTPLVSRQP